jgi:hypothetical protein
VLPGIEEYGQEQHGRVALATRDVDADRAGDLRAALSALVLHELKEGGFLARFRLHRRNGSKHVLPSSHELS